MIGFELTDNNLSDKDLLRLQEIQKEDLGCYVVVRDISDCRVLKKKFKLENFLI